MRVGRFFFSWAAPVGSITPGPAVPGSQRFGAADGIIRVVGSLALSPHTL
jgi:hypothetical protein